VPADAFAAAPAAEADAAAGAGFADLSTEL
jgi:hypothetical protein